MSAISFDEVRTDRVPGTITSEPAPREHRCRIRHGAIADLLWQHCKRGLFRRLGNDRITAHQGEARFQQPRVLQESLKAVMTPHGPRGCNSRASNGGTFGGNGKPVELARTIQLRNHRYRSFPCTSQDSEMILPHSRSPVDQVCLSRLAVHCQAIEPVHPGAVPVCLAIFQRLPRSC